MPKTQFAYDPTKIVPQELWDLDAIQNDPLNVRVREEETRERDGRRVLRREIYYTSHLWQGQPIRIAAHVALPESDGPLPAMVMGTSSMDGAESFARTHNLAVIALDRPGTGDSNGPPDVYQTWIALEDDPRDGWMWHFITSSLRAITYMQQQPEVRPDRIGITGGSRGGTMSFIANGMDPRITLAIPTATCGDILLAFKHDGWANNLYTDEDGNPGIPDTFRVFALYGDPIHYAKTQHGAVMLVLGAQDEYFPIYTVKTTCDAVTSDKFRLCLIPDWDHGLFSSDNAELDTYDNREEAGKRTGAAAKHAIECCLHDKRVLPHTPHLSWLPEGDSVTFSATVDQTWPVGEVTLCYSADGAYFFKREPMPKVLDAFKEKFQTTLDLGAVEDDKLAFYVEVAYEDGPYLMSPPEFGVRFKQTMRTPRPPGEPPEFVIEDVTYASTIDPLPDLRAKVAYQKGRQNLPIVVLLAGGTPGSSKALEGDLDRLSRRGVFAVLPTLRGRDGSPGQSDCLGREVCDIVDAVGHVKASFPEQVNPSLASIVGYSSGATLSLLAGARFPDAFRTIVAYFPITDRAEQPYWELYERKPANELEEKALRIAKMVEKLIGGVPSAVPDLYASRRILSAVGNNGQSAIHLFHDLDDGLVPYTHSQKYFDEAKAAGLTNVRFHLSYPDDGRRWTHGHPKNVPDLVAGEHKFIGQITGGKPDKPVLPEAGELVVPGYVRTEGFEVWLGDGLDSVATLTYSLSDASSRFALARHSGNANARCRILLDAERYGSRRATVSGRAVAPAQERGKLAFEVSQGDEMVLTD